MCGGGGEGGCQGSAGWCVCVGGRGGGGEEGGKGEEDDG